LYQITIAIKEKATVVFPESTCAIIAIFRLFRLKVLGSPHECSGRIADRLNLYAAGGIEIRA